MLTGTKLKKGINVSCAVIEEMQPLIFIRYSTNSLLLCVSVVIILTIFLLEVSTIQSSNIWRD